MSRGTFAWMAIVIALAYAVIGAQPSRPELTVFAASDLGPAFQKIVPQFEKTVRATVTVVLGSSGNLSQQIRNGAPADIFFAANESFIESLVAEGLLRPDSRLRYARGRLVTVTLKTPAVRIQSLQDLADPKVRRVAIANPAHAPYGLAAQQALEASGLWTAVKPKIVFGENVQQAVQFVRSGSVDAGIVARSIVETPELAWTLVDTKWHAPLNQTAAVVLRSQHQELASSFLQFIAGTQGRLVMRQFGFLLPGEDF